MLRDLPQVEYAVDQRMVDKQRDRLHFDQPGNVNLYRKSN